MKIGIYKIENEINGKVYIGSGQIRQRYYSHMSKLRRDVHENKYLQRAWNKHGEEKFEFVVLIYCSKENLGFYEKKFIVDGYKSYKKENGYNFKKGRENAEMVDEVCEKISDSLQEYYENNEHHMKGKTRSQEIRDKISKYHKGKKLSEETRQKLSKAKKEYYKNNQNPMKGREHSEETTDLMSENRRGEKNNQAILNSDEVKQIKILLEESDLTHKEIGNKFNVTGDCIANISCGRTWKHIEID